MDRRETLQVGFDLDYLVEERKRWRVDKNAVTRLHKLLRGLGFVELLSKYEKKKDSAPSYYYINIRLCHVVFILIYYCHFFLCIKKSMMWKSFT